MVHKPKHKVHSFRGLLADCGQDEINLERQNLNVAYRIVKLNSMLTGVGADCNSWIAVWREKQDPVPCGTVAVDFNNPDLIGSAILHWDNDPLNQSGDSIIFDNILFSRNIYVTHTNDASEVACNYYLEIEEVPVGAATLMQLKLAVARKLNLRQDPVVT